MVVLPVTNNLPPGSTESSTASDNNARRTSEGVNGRFTLASAQATVPFVQVKRLRSHSSKPCARDTAMVVFRVCRFKVEPSGFTSETWSDVGLPLTNRAL